MVNKFAGRGAHNSAASAEAMLRITGRKRRFPAIGGIQRIEPLRRHKLEIGRTNNLEITQ